MSSLQGVADTLYLPLAARIYVSKRFPEYFYDEKAMSLESEMPYQQIIDKLDETKQYVDTKTQNIDGGLFTDWRDS